MSKFIDATYIPYTPREYVGFDNVEIQNNFTDLSSPDDTEINLTTRYCKSPLNNIILESPILALSDDNESLCDFRYIDAFYAGNINTLFETYSKKNNAGIVIGTHPDDQNIVDFFFNEKKVKHLCVYILSRTGSGDNQLLIQQVRNLKLKYGNAIHIIAGDVTLPLTISTLIKVGVDGIVLDEKCNVNQVINARNTLYSLQSNCLLIGKSSKDFVYKYFAAGVDLCFQHYYATDIVKLRKFMYMTNSRNLSDYFNNTYFYIIQ